MFHLSCEFPHEARLTWELRRGPTVWLSEGRLSKQKQHGIKAMQRQHEVEVVRQDGGKKKIGRARGGVFQGEESKGEEERRRRRLRGRRGNARSKVDYRKLADAMFGDDSDSDERKRRGL